MTKYNIDKRQTYLELHNLSLDKDSDLLILSCSNAQNLKVYSYAYKKASNL